jgi:hypothetical protein
VSSDDLQSSVSLKEYFLALLAAERERVNQHKALVELRFDLADRAQQLEHIEMLRRLELLNHAHENARQKEASFVGREVYESQNKEHYKWRDEVNSALAARQGRSSVTTSVTGAVGGLALSALLGLIMYITKVVLSGVPK